jgi:hypothetical protein
MPAKDRPKRLTSKAVVQLVRTNRSVPDVFHRYTGNPILQAADWPYTAHTVFNPGATRLA